MRAPIDHSYTRQEGAHPIASEELLQDWRGRALRVEEEVAKAVIGQQGTLRLISVSLFPRGHVLARRDAASPSPPIEPGRLLRHGDQLVTFFFNEINRARPQVQSLLLRAMAERTVSAFNQEFRFPHMTVFADRNRVEQEETFELASAARDRFMFELRMGTPADDAIRRALVFDPSFHDVD